MDFKKLYSFEELRISKLPGQKKFQSDLSTIKPRNLATDSGTFGKFTFVSQDFHIQIFLHKGLNINYYYDVEVEENF